MSTKNFKHTTTEKVEIAGIIYIKVTTQMGVVYSHGGRTFTVTHNETVEEYTVILL